jgi:Tfp pilus assembly protein PilN
MIEINLLPEDLKAKAESRKTSINLDPKYFIYLLPFVLATLLCVHIYLAIKVIVKNNQIANLSNQWRTLEPQRSSLENFNKENTIISQDTSVIKQLTEQRIIWAEKLNKLSTSIPAGIWFTELSVASHDFTLRGSVISLRKDELGFIKKFIDNLKGDTGFSKSFNNLELGSVQRKSIGGYDVFDFTLVGTLK